MNKKDFPQLFQDRIERMNKLFLEGTKNTDNPHNFEEDPLYDYEEFCMLESLKFIKVFKDKATYTEIGKNFAKKYPKNPTIHDFIEHLNKKYTLKLSSDHSSNSIVMALRFAQIYIMMPEKFIYMHGALVSLVGDEGYYDDREDVK